MFIAVLIILQCAKEKTNNFILALLSAVAVIKFLVAGFLAFFNLFNGFSLLFSQASSMHIAGGSSLGVSLSAYEFFFALFTVTTLFIFLQKIFAMRIRCLFLVLFIRSTYKFFLFCLNIFRLLH